MSRIVFLFILICFFSCTEKKGDNFENPPSSNYDLKELEIYKKPQDLVLYLKYDSTNLIDDDVILFFTFSVRNTTNDTIRLLAENQPSYHPFKIDGSRILEFYESPMRILYSNFPIYKYFNPKETTSYTLKLKLADGVQKLNGQKIRIGFEPWFGSENQSPIELIEMYKHIDLRGKTENYWSNNVGLKDDFVFVK